MECGSQRISDQAAGESGIDQTLVRPDDLGRHVLLNGVTAIGVFGDALGVADEHGDDAVDVSDAIDVVLQREPGKRAGDVDVGPELRARGVGAGCWYDRQVTVAARIEMPRSAGKLRVNVMLSPVLRAWVSMRIASSGTPRPSACSLKWTASPRGNRSTVVGALAPVKTVSGNSPP
jgi:hypothetical protein